MILDLANIIEFIGSVQDRKNQSKHIMELQVEYTKTLIPFKEIVKQHEICNRHVTVK